MSGAVHRWQISKKGLSGTQAASETKRCWVRCNVPEPNLDIRYELKTDTVRCAYSTKVRCFRRGTYSWPRGQSESVASSLLSKNGSQEHKQGISALALAYRAT